MILPRRFYVLLMFLLVGILATACLPSSPKGQIKFMVFGDPAELQAYQTLVNAFESSHDQISVELIHIPDQGDYRTRLAADFVAGTPADVVLLNYRRYASFAVKGLLEPLGPYLEKSTLISTADFYTEALDPFRWKGQLICIPQNVSSLVVYYNKSLFDQAGLDYPQANWTWDDFLQSAQALTRDTNGDGEIDQFGVGIEATLIRLAPFVWQSGGELTTNPQPTRLLLDSAESMEAAQWFVALQTVHHVAPDAEAEASEDSETRFQNGSIGVYLNSRRVVPTLREIKNFDWDVVALPQYRHQASILHTDGYCLPSASKNKPAAWAFIEFANSAEGQAIVAATGRTVPSLKSVAESAAFLDPTQKPQNSRVFLDVIPYLRAVPVMSNWADIEGILDEELERAFYGNTTVEEAIQTAIQRAQPYFSEDE